LDSLKPIIDAIDPDSLVTIAVSLTVRLRKLDFAGLSALRTPEIFKPTVTDDNEVQRHVSSLSLQPNGGHSKGSTKMLRGCRDALRWRLKELGTATLPCAFVKAGWVKYPQHPQSNPRYGWSATRRNRSICWGRQHSPAANIFEFVHEGEGGIIVSLARAERSARTRDE
jgi:hypothetical protein